MRVVAASSLLCALVLCGAGATTAAAQDPPPPIGPLAFDLRGSFPGFPRDPQLAASRGLDVRELPGRGLGLDAGAHLYLVKWRAITFGVGAQLTLARAKRSPPAQATALRSVTERFVAFTPQLSFNFGTGHGWSYLSGGLGPSQWSVVPDGADPGPADEQRLRVVNYGGGARWFARPHVAFTFDVRFYDIDPGPPFGDRPGSPRARMIVIGAGVSVK
jgi:hypothetical protein